METQEEIPPGGPNENGPIYDEVEAVLSDAHLSEGPILNVARKPNPAVRLFRTIAGRKVAPDIRQMLNPLEDFPDDGVFCSFLDRLVERFGGARVLRLRLLGDMFDFLAVPWRGELKDPPFEGVACRKMERIFVGHQRFFDALTAFVTRTNAELVIFAGNHDLHLVWPRVQELILRRICGDDPVLRARVRFIDHRQGFREIHRGVLYDHGMNAEIDTSIDPKNAILTHGMGGELKRPILNQPLGNYMTIGLAAPLKLRNKLIGRMPTEKDIWLHAARFNWQWGLYAGCMVVWILIYNQFFAFWDIRRKTGLLTMLRVILGTYRKNPVGEWAAKLLGKDGVRVVVNGHSHIESRVTGPDGTSINTGTWSKKLRFVWPQFPRLWKRFRWLEPAWRSTVHFFRTGELRLATKILKIVGFLALVAALLTFLWTTFPEHGPQSLSWHPNDLKIYVGLGLIILVTVGLWKFLIVEPDTEPATRYTFALVRHGPDEALNAELMEYRPDDGTFRECV